MNLAETIRGLRRRWYIVVPGLILAVVVAAGAWFLVRPGYERTATQLLLPGTQSIPEQGNPFLFLGGLTNAADVLVRAVGAESVLAEVEASYPGTEIEVTRDGTTSGPVILTKVTAGSDADAAAVTAFLVERAENVLDGLQDEENIPSDNRITVVPLTVDDASTLQQRDRLVATAGAGLVIVLLTLLLASLVDGLALQRRRRGAATGAGSRGEESRSADDDDIEADEYLETLDGQVTADEVEPVTTVGSDDVPHSDELAAPFDVESDDAAGSPGDLESGSARMRTSRRSR